MKKYLLTLMPPAADYTFFEIEADDYTENWTNEGVAFAFFFFRKGTREIVQTVSVPRTFAFLLKDLEVAFAVPDNLEQMPKAVS